MVIAAKSLSKYFHSLVFPVDILPEKGDQIALNADRELFELLLEKEMVIGIGSWKRIRHLRLTKPLDKVEDDLKNFVPFSIHAYGQGQRTVFKERLGPKDAYAGLKCFTLKRLGTLPQPDLTDPA